MKILLVGGRRFDEATLDGPTSAFESLIQGFDQLGIPVSVFPDQKETKVRAYARLFLVLLKKWDVINVHLNCNYGLLVGLMRFRSRSVYLTVHGYSPLESVVNQYNAIMHLLQVKYLFRKNIYVSNLIRTRVEMRESIDKGCVIRNAVGLVNTNAVRRGEGRPVDIFSLCGYSTTKGVDFLLRALGSFSRTLSCLVAGHQRDMLRRDMLPTKPNLTLECRGPLSFDEAVAAYGRARIYIQPSKYESFGIPVIEAMCVGTPVIVTQSTGVAEFLSNEVDALIVTYGDDNGLVTAILRLLDDSDLYRRLSENGRETAAHFSSHNVAREYLDLFLRQQGSPAVTSGSAGG